MTSADFHKPAGHVRRSGALKTTSLYMSL